MEWNCGPSDVKIVLMAYGAYRLYPNIVILSGSLEKTRSSYLTERDPNNKKYIYGV